jgi:hypothetical protein
MQMKIAVTGASGFIGSRLVKLLQDEGHRVVALTRNEIQSRPIFPKTLFPAVDLVQYDPYRLDDWARALEGCNGVVHLAGAPIAGRWTPDFKSQIKQSREIGTRRIVEAMAQTSPRPSVLVSSSAARYYGSSETVTFDETSPPHPGQDFLAGVCRIWEAEANAAEGLGLRTVILRHGIVLDMTPRFRNVLKTFGSFVGGRIGSGRQWLSWIHREDTVQIILNALTDEAMRGVYNATGPQPVRMEDFTRELGAAVGGRFRVPVPGFIIQGLLGDGATVILDGQRVVPARLVSEGYSFRLPELRKAIASSL